MPPLEFCRTVDRIRFEFFDMPNLQMTVAQIARRWGLDMVLCRAVVDELVRSMFLQTTPSGQLARTDVIHRIGG